MLISGKGVTLSLLLALLLAGAVPAHAQDWDGGIVGVMAGIDEVRDEAYTHSILALPIAPVPVGRFKETAPTLGVLAGYRMRAGPIVLGGEADADWSSASLTEREIGATSRIRPRWRASLRAVAGVPVGRALVFATAGRGLMSTRYAYNYNFGRPLPTERTTRTLGHWVAGGGVEFALGRLHPRIEYRYSPTRRVANGQDNLIFRHKVSVHGLRVGVVLPL